MCRAISSQWLGKHVPVAVQSIQRDYKEGNWSKNSSVGREPPFREDFRTDAEEQPLLEAITRNCLVKTLQAGKDSAYAAVICKVWKLMIVLELFVVTTFKSINQIIWNPIYSHSILCESFIKVLYKIITERFSEISWGIYFSNTNFRHFQIISYMNVKN
jgi:hypothetical protein